MVSAEELYEQLLSRERILLTANETFTYGLQVANSLIQHILNQEKFEKEAIQEVSNPKTYIESSNQDSPSKKKMRSELSPEE